MQATGTLTSELAKGAVAGAAAVWVMDRVDWLMVEHEDPAAWRKTKEVRPNHKDPAHNLVDTVAKAFGGESIPQPNPAGLAVHYAIGIGPAALYATMRDHIPGGVLGRGVTLGLTLSALEDEALNPLLGLAAKPQRYPWQAHARSLVAHLVFGIVTEAALSLLDRRERGSSPSQRRQGRRTSRRTRSSRY